MTATRVSPRQIGLDNPVSIFNFLSRAQIDDVTSRTGAIPLDTAFAAAVNSIATTTGGVIDCPPGVYNFTGGNVFAQSKRIVIRGSGAGVSGSGATVFKHTGNNTCFTFNAANLWARVALEDFEVQGNNGALANFASLSDASGYSTNRISGSGYASGAFFVLHNKIAWTEQFVAEDCMLRDALAGFMFKRTAASGGTDSFFGFTLHNISCVPGGNGALVYMASTVGNELLLYGADISCRLWHEVGGTMGFFVSDYSTFVQSRVLVLQDGMPIVDGTDALTFRQFGSGQIDVNAQILAQQGVNYYSTAALGATPTIRLPRELYNCDPSYGQGQLSGPLCRVRGAAYSMGDAAQVIDKTFLIDTLQRHSSYRVRLYCYGTNYAYDATYIVSVSDLSYIAGVTKIAGLDTANFKCQTFNTVAEGTYQLNDGLAFQVIVNAATIGVSLAWKMEMEML